MNLGGFLASIGSATGLILGGVLGWSLFKENGYLFAAVMAAGGSTLCAILGYWVGAIPRRLASRSIFREIEGKSTDELRADLKKEREGGICPFPHLTLLQLQARGEDIQSELPLVLEMLEAGEEARRARWWLALKYAFSELVSHIRDYSPSDPLELCHKNVEKLRNSVTGAVAKRLDGIS